MKGMEAQKAKNNVTLPLHITDLIDSTDYQLRCNLTKETM